MYKLSRCLRASWSLMLRLQWKLAFLAISWGLTATSSELGRTIRDDMNSSMDDNSTNGTSSDDSEPVLSAEAIANITATGVGICIISSTLCYLFLFFNKQERMDRVQMALERNRQIERQLAEARAKERQEKERQVGGEGGGEGGGGGGRDELLFSQVHHSHEALHPSADVMATRIGGEEELLAGSGSTPTPLDYETTPPGGRTTPTYPHPQPATSEEEGPGEGEGLGEGDSIRPIDAVVTVVQPIHSSDRSAP